MVFCQFTPIVNVWECLYIPVKFHYTHSVESVVVSWFAFFLKKKCIVYFILYFILFFSIFCCTLQHVGPLVPWLGTGPTSPALAEQSLNHWAAGEVPTFPIDQFEHCFLCLLAVLENLFCEVSLKSSAHFSTRLSVVLLIWRVFILT